VFKTVEVVDIIVDAQAAGVDAQPGENRSARVDCTQGMRCDVERQAAPGHEAMGEQSLVVEHVTDSRSAPAAFASTDAFYSSCA